MKLTIPTDLKEITLSQYRRYQKVVEDNPNDDVFVCIQMIAIFCNLEVADVMKIPAVDFAEIVSTISQTLDQRPQLTTTFKMDGVDYGFIPNLEQITIGEHAVIDTTINNEEQIELMLSVMYRKITKKASVFYEIETYNPDIDLSEKFKNVPMHIVKGAQVFFWNLFSELLQNTLLSIPKIAKAEGVDLEAVFQSVGGGITLLSESQESIKSELKMWEEKIFTNHSRYYLT